MLKLFSFKKQYTYDVFLCHAFEDQDKLTDQLYAGLEKKGISVWYSAQHMPVGEDLDETIINRVIPACRYGVVVVSRDYFTAGWAKKELLTLRNHEKLRGYNMILPVWHEVDEEEVKKELPFLAGRFAARTDKGIAPVIKKLSAKIIITRIPKWLDVVRRRVYRHKFSMAVLFLIPLLAAGVYRYSDLLTSWYLNEEEFTSHIESGIKRVDLLANQSFTQWAAGSHAIPCSTDKLKLLHAAFIPDGRKGTHTYRFLSGDQSFNGRNNLEAFGLEAGGLYNNFGITTGEAFISCDSSRFEFALYNKKAVEYSIVNIQRGKKQCVVSVQYAQALRCVFVKIIKSADGKFKTTHHIYSLKPCQKYVFEKAGDQWSYAAPQ